MTKLGLGRTWRGKPTRAGARLKTWMHARHTSLRKQQLGRSRGPRIFLVLPSTRWPASSCTGMNLMVSFLQDKQITQAWAVSLLPHPQSPHCILAPCLRLHSLFPLFLTLAERAVLGWAMVHEPPYGLNSSLQSYMRRGLCWET